LKDYQAQPFTDNAVDTGAAVSDPSSAGQIWVRGEPKVRLYSTVAATFAAAKQLTADKNELRVVFVHDRVSGNKLFADKVWYVKNKAGLSAFLLKPAADEYAKQQAGTVLDYDAARSGI
jgi:NitT/TauT family transport system substrate-binding protein